MAARRNSALLGLMALLLLPVGAGAVGKPPVLQVDNVLKACVVFDAPQLLAIDGHPFATLPYKKLQSIADCGCKSPVASYTVMSDRGTYQSFVISGNFTFPDDTRLVLPLAVSAHDIDGEKLKISLSCANPD